MRLMIPLLLLVLVPGGPPRAQPACGQASAGVTACLAGKLCRCHHEQGGSMTGQATGWRWDCGALRPGCGAAEPPATLPGATPNGFEAPPQLLLAPPLLPAPALPPAVELPGQRQPWR